MLQDRLLYRKGPPQRLPTQTLTQRNRCDNVKPFSTTLSFSFKNWAYDLTAIGDAFQKKKEKKQIQTRSDLLQHLRKTSLKPRHVSRTMSDHHEETNGKASPPEKELKTSIGDILPQKQIQTRSDLLHYLRKTSLKPRHVSRPGSDCHEELNKKLPINREHSLQYSLNKMNVFARLLCIASANVFFLISHNSPLICSEVCQRLGT